MAEEFETVQMTEDGGYIVNGDLHVPVNSGNRHFLAVQDWIGAGNTPAPFVAVVKSRAARVRDAMKVTENPAVIARKIEDVIEHLVNGRAISKSARDWAADRRIRRGGA